jgi:hypothetical protein
MNPFQRIVVRVTQPPWSITMRRLFLALPFLVACAGGETPPADSAAPAVAALTEADVAGTWTGTAVIEGTDSVFAHWTNMCGSGTCRFTSTESPADTVTSTYMIAGDSVVGNTQPYAERSMGGTMVVDNWVGRPTAGQVTGYGTLKMADRDSVLMRYRFTGTRTP